MKITRRKNFTTTEFWHSSLRSLSSLSDANTLFKIITKGLNYGRDQLLSEGRQKDGYHQGFPLTPFLSSPPICLALNRSWQAIFTIAQNVYLRCLKHARCGPQYRKEQSLHNYLIQLRVKTTNTIITLIMDSKKLNKDKYKAVRWENHRSPHHHHRYLLPRI